MRHTATLRRFGSVKSRGSDKIWGLSAAHPAVVEARPLFPSRVVSAEKSPRLLVSGHNNRKIGAKITKGEWAGLKVFTLTLAERTTCPTQCAMWRGCYGNSMHWSRRHDHGGRFQELLAKEVAQKAADFSRFVVRLHVLGDFFSVAYVHLWGDLLALHGGLHIYGYTARSHAHDEAIYGALAELNQRYPERCAIRFSGNEIGPMRTIVVRDAVPENVVVCPAALHQSECCSTCALCWSPAARHKTIAFPLHGGTKDRK